jgi:hypothetical protein
MPLFNDDTAIVTGIDLTNSEGILIYGTDSASLARQLRVNSDGNVQIDLRGELKTQFGQTRIASPFTMADFVNKYGFDLFEFSSSSVGSATVTSVISQSAIRLAVTATNADYARIRTNTFYRYQAGKEQNIKISCYIPGGGKINQISRFGYFDDNDGLFFALSGSNFGIYKRFSSLGGTVQETFISQSAFNKNKLDGTSGSYVLDVKNANLYEIRFQWLGVGNIEFVINNTVVHTIENINAFKGPYMKTGVLPVAAEIQNNGASTANELNFICSSVESDGGSTPPKYTFNAYNTTDISTTTTERPLLLIRPGTLFRTVENRVVGLPIRLSVSTEGTRAGFRIILNPTSVTGGTWISASIDNSAFEYNISATAFTGGETIYRGFLPNSNDSRDLDLKDFFEYNSRVLRLNAFGTNVDTLLIAGINEATGTTLMRASLTWQEIR